MAFPSSLNPALPLSDSWQYGTGFQWKAAYGSCTRGKRIAPPAAPASASYWSPLFQPERPVNIGSASKSYVILTALLPPGLPAERVSRALVLSDKNRDFTGKKPCLNGLRVRQLYLTSSFLFRYPSPQSIPSVLY